MKQSSQRSLAAQFVIAAFVAMLAALPVYLHSFVTNSHMPSQPWSGFAADSGDVNLPKMMLWAWERPEDLRFVNPREAGVAFLARTIELRSISSRETVPGNASYKHGSFAHGGPTDGVTLKLRLQPLQVPTNAPLMAVVRIETSRDLWHRQPDERGRIGEAVSANSIYSDKQRELVAIMAAASARLPGVTAVQIDFDASKSERPFYAALLQDIRHQLPAGTPLSITALASWCIGDTWLNQLPPGTIDEAVPMLFRMGPDSVEVVSYLDAGKDFQLEACRRSLGVSTDEAWSQELLAGKLGQREVAWRARRIYVFSPKSWAQQDVKAVIAEAARWHEE